MTMISGKLAKMPHDLRMILAKSRPRSEGKHGSCVAFMVHTTPTWIRIERLIGRADNWRKKGW